MAGANQFVMQTLFARPGSRESENAPLDGRCGVGRSRLKALSHYRPRRQWR
jgi:hypothetical protein